MFEKEAKDYQINTFARGDNKGLYSAFKDGAEYGYNKANEWFDAKESIPLPKKA